MAKKTNRTLALMSIHPYYAELILQGAKRVEFRRTRFATVPSAVVIYATAPIQKLVGIFEVEGVDEATPVTLWSKYSDIGGISFSEYRRYFEGVSASGFAIRIGRVVAFEQAIPLSRLSGVTHPPQSFRYLSRSILQSATTELPLYM